LKKSTFSEKTYAVNIMVAVFFPFLFAGTKQAQYNFHYE